MSIEATKEVRVYSWALQPPESRTIPARLGLRLTKLLQTQMPQVDREFQNEKDAAYFHRRAITIHEKWIPVLHAINSELISIRTGIEERKRIVIQAAPPNQLLNELTYLFELEREIERDLQKITEISQYIPRQTPLKV